MLSIRSFSLDHHHQDVAQHFQHQPCPSPTEHVLLLAPHPSPWSRWSTARVIRRLRVAADRLVHRTFSQAHSEAVSASPAPSFALPSSTTHALCCDLHSPFIMCYATRRGIFTYDEEGSRVCVFASWYAFFNSRVSNCLLIAFDAGLWNRKFSAMRPSLLPVYQTRPDISEPLAITAAIFRERSPLAVGRTRAVCASVLFVASRRAVLWSYGVLGWWRKAIACLGSVRLASVLKSKLIYSSSPYILTHALIFNSALINARLVFGDSIQSRCSVRRSLWPLGFT